MSKQYYDAIKVRDAARGQWLEIFLALAPHLEVAIQRAGRHTSCPVHGGKDGFRLFKDTHLTGGGICNTCGPKSDGISLLMWSNGWDFPTALQHVAGLLGVEPEASKKTPYVKSARVNTQPSDKKPVRAYIGTIADFGKAPYQDNKANDSCYFVEISNKEGNNKRTLWGVDLERAIQESNAQKGDFVGINNLGREAVTVEDSEGQKVNTHRNTWVIEVLKSNSKPEHKAKPLQEVVKPALKAVEKEHPYDPYDEHELVDQSENVSSIFQDKPWLKELKAELDDRLERQSEYAKTLSLRIQAEWDKCVPINAEGADAARVYLNSRRLGTRGVSSDALRFNPNLAYYDSDGNKVGDYPAIVAAIRDVEGNIVTLHRTYLSAMGTKARIPGDGATKKMMSIPHGLDVKGCSIQLMAPVNGVLGVSEGIETGLSGFRATGIPVWAAVNAVLLENFEVPKGVHTIVIWADKDVSMTGERSAEILKARLDEEGIACIIMLPKTFIPRNAKSVDWNDVLVKEGLMGFPEPRILKAISGCDSCR